MLRTVCFGFYEPMPEGAPGSRIDVKPVLSQSKENRFPEGRMRSRGCKQKQNLQCQHTIFFLLKFISHKNFFFRVALPLMAIFSHIVRKKTDQKITFLIEIETPVSSHYFLLLKLISHKIFLKVIRETLPHLARYFIFHILIFL